MIDPGISGRVALVTGCNRPAGIGAAIARGLGAQGATVALAVAPGSIALDAPANAVPGAAETRGVGSVASAVRDPSLNGRAAMEEVQRAGGTAALFEADLADPSACASLLDRVEEALGHVEILVNNAAHSRPDTFLSAERGIFSRTTIPVTSEALDAHHAVNVRAPALLMADFHRRHAQGGGKWGRIINVSTDGAAAFPSEVSYGASKNALESLSRSAAHEFGPAGVTVNIVALGPIQSGWITEAMQPAICHETPLGRVGYPDDVADVVVFLASDQARWITGQTIYVGGGHRMV
jgi:3-oxoacyl-[acyl-carrier protein] reductase